MKHRILILDTYYPAYLRSFYSAHEGLAGVPYDEHLKTLLDTCFGTSDFYSAAFRALGHEAHDVAVNCAPLQRRWALENADWLSAAREASSFVLSPSPEAISRIDLDVVRAQIAAFAPDILYLQHLTALGDSFLREIKRNVRLLIGQVASPLDGDFDYSVYDLIFTSFPHYVPMFRESGVGSEYVKLAFEPRVLERVGAVAMPRQHDVVFIGSYSAAHHQGTAVLEEIARSLPVDFWGRARSASLLILRYAVATMAKPGAWTCSASLASRA